MKKILSLLALLVTTVAAMATSYTDKVVYKMNTTTGSNEEQELTITDNGDNTYDVALADLNTSESLGGLSLGSFTFSSVAGTTTDGVTTISASATSTLANSNFTEKGPGTLEVKFNDSKAYLHYTSTVSYFSWANYAVEITFGTDEGWSGGGSGTDPEQPVIEGNPIAELTDYSPNGSKFEFPFTCDFAKQKLVWKVDFTNAGWTANQLVFTIGTSDADLSKWATPTGGNAHFYYTKSTTGAKLVLHYLHQEGEDQTRNDVDNIAIEDVTTFTLDAEGFHVGDALVVPAEKMPKLYAGGTEFLFGSKEGSGRSYATYKYVTVIDLPETPDPNPDPDPDPKPTEVDLAEANYKPAGHVFNFHSPINWDTQKFVTSMDLSTCTCTASENEGVLAFGNEDYTWGGTDGSVFSFFSISRGNQLNVYATANDGNQAVKVDVTQPVKVEVSKAGGMTINGTQIYAPEKLTNIFTYTDLYVGSDQGKQVSNATYKYMKIVPLDWTEPTEPVDPDPFDPVSTDYHTSAYVDYDGTITNIEGGANVTVTEYEKDKYSVTFEDVTDGVNAYGNLTINNLTATTSDEGTQYNLTDESVATWTKVTGAGIMAGITEQSTSTFSDFFCALGELAGNDYNFALTFKVNVADSYIKVVFGEKAPEATEYTGTWNIVRKGGEDMESVEGAKVSILLKDENTAQVTIPVFSDQDEETEGTVGPLTFDVTYGYAVKGEQQSMIFSCTDEKVEMTNGDWNGYSASVSMDGELVGDELTAKFNIVLGEMDSYTYELGFNYEPFIAVTVPFTDVANVTFGGQTTNFDEATVDFKEYEADKYSITYKNVTLNGNNIGDLTIENITGTLDETTNVATLATTATTATWTRVTENNALGVDAGDEAEIRNFEGTATPSADEESEDYGSLKFKFGFNVQGEWADVVFGEKHEEETDVVTLAENYQADGTGFSFNAPIDWETQKVVISATTASCQRSTEHLFGVGVDGTSWNKNVHAYYTTSDSQLQCYWDGADGNGNNNTGKFACDGTVKVEISKANGLVVNGDTKIAASRMDGLYEMTNIVVGSGEASNQESYAYYNYIKVVPLDWKDPSEPVEPEVKTYDGQLVVQDGLTEENVLVKETAQAVVTVNTDGTASVTMKDVTLGEVSGDITFTGTYVAMEDNGENVFMLEGTSDEATTTLFGEEITCVINGTYPADDEVKFTFEMYNESHSVYYVGLFSKNAIETAISNVSVDANAAGTQIYTISGAKVNSLQKGINIVRTADGKTVKVLRK